MMRFDVVPARAGTGLPLVLLHGFLGTPASWDAVADRLGGSPIARGALPGHGPDPWTVEGSGFLAIADAIAAAVPFDRPAVLVGYSMGARLALAMALRRPERFAHAVLVGGTPGLDEAERPERAAWDDAQAERVLSLGLPAFVDGWEAMPLFESQRSLPAPLRAAQRAERLSHTAAGLAWALRALGLGRMPRLELASARVPVTAVAGALDRKFARAAAAIAAEAPRARALIVPGAGHNVALEAPGALAAAIAAAADRGFSTEEAHHG